MISVRGNRCRLFSRTRDNFFLTALALSTVLARSCAIAVINLIFCPGSTMVLVRAGIVPSTKSAFQSCRRRVFETTNRFTQHASARTERRQTIDILSRPHDNFFLRERKCGEGRKVTGLSYMLAHPTRTNNSRDHGRCSSSVAFTAAALASFSALSNMTKENVVLAETSLASSQKPLHESYSTHITKNEPKCDLLTMPFPSECIHLDTYNGVTVDLAELPSEQTQNADDFRSKLRQALTIWKEEGRRGIWCKIPTSFAYLIPAVADLGFDFQYAEKGRVIMTNWLPTDSASRLPHGPTHQVGIGALVLHPVTGKMLVVQEKSGPAAARKLWKMPTGLADPGEDVVDAAVREVKEETGLDVDFDHIICIRQAHTGHGAFNKSDMFFVCQLILSPMYEQNLEKGLDIELKPQEEEIADARWMDIEHFVNQDLWKGSPLYSEMNTAIREAARKLHRRGSTYFDDSDSSEATSSDPNVVGFVGKRLPVGFRPGENVIYVVGKKKPKRDEKDR